MDNRASAASATTAGRSHRGAGFAEGTEAAAGRLARGGGIGKPQFNRGSGTGLLAGVLPSYGPAGRCGTGAGDRSVAFQPAMPPFVGAFFLRGTSIPMAQRLARPGGGKLAIVHHNLAVDQHEVEALRVLMGLGVSGFVLHAHRIEIGRASASERGQPCE